MLHFLLIFIRESLPTPKIIYHTQYQGYSRSGFIEFENDEITSETLLKLNNSYQCHKEGGFLLKLAYSVEPNEDRNND